MESRRLGRTKQEVSLLGFGALEIGRNWGIGPEATRERPDPDESSALLHHVLDKGITLIDTAAAYHLSEERIGFALTARRSEYFLATKCGEHNQEPGTYYDFSSKAITESIASSLEKLQTSQIDLIQIHFGPNPQQVLDSGQTLRAMKAAQEKGQVRFLGASCDLDVAYQIIESQDYDVIQLTYNLLDRRAEDTIKKAADRDIGVLVRFPLAMGWLTPRADALKDTSPDQWQRIRPYLEIVGQDIQLLPRLALQFIARLPEVSSILVGTKSKDHLNQAIAALDTPLPDPWILEASKTRAQTSF